MAIFFITGTSGAGKSTLIAYLKKKLPENFFAIYDFDEVGVPQNADKVWRQKTTNYWLRQAQEHNNAQKSTIICGVSVPSEVVDSLKNPQIPLFFGFITIDDKIIKQRLAARGWPEKLIHDNIKWAHYLEAEVKRKPHHLIVDGTEDPEKIADIFIAWIVKHTNYNL